MAAADDLIQHVYSYFLDAYRQVLSNASEGEVVAFEPMGFVPDCLAASTTGATAASLEEISQLADVLPSIDGGVFTRTGRTVSIQYATMVDLAKPSSAESLATFADLKAYAGRLHEDAASDGELDGPKASYATPSDWYNLGNAANWASYSFDSSVQAPPAPPAKPGIPAAPTPGPPAPVAPGVHLMWHVMPQAMRPLVSQRAAEPTPPIEAAVHHLAPTGIAPMLRSAPAITAAPHPAAPVVASLMPPARIDRIDFPSRDWIAHLEPQTRPQPVETPVITISFDYCLVRLRRPWLSGDFLAASGWYVPGVRAGDYASGPPENTGSFAALPVAFIAVKNLQIRGSWSENDAAAIGNSAAFGPFSLLKQADNMGALNNPGLQIIAWICSLQPRLPPDSDPSLQPAAPTPGA